MSNNTMEVRKPMEYKDILYGNHFANLSDDELETVWEQMRFFYANGYTQDGTLLDSMRKQYCSESPTGVVIMEQDFLRAVACRHFQIQKDIKDIPIEQIYEDRKSYLTSYHGYEPSKVGFCAFIKKKYNTKLKETVNYLKEIFGEEEWFANL